MKRIHVAAGILRDEHGQILITERQGDGAFTGLWEFPGGKVRKGEAPPAALRRELAEELGIGVTACAHFMSVRHDYPDRQVAIDFYFVTGWRDQPRGLEGQGLRWLSPELLDEQLLLPADAPVVRALKGSADT